MIAPYPWQAEHWSQVGRNLAAGRLPHALLLHGRAGVGKRDFALQLAALLLCEARVQNDTVCGACRGCHLFKAGTHPDFRLLTPLEDSTTIVIDQIRGVIEFYTLKAHYAGTKVVILHPADTMNRPAANALLKLLEEPPAGAVFLLVANAYDRIPPTIRSRCQALAMDKVSTEVALEWLATTVGEVSTREDLQAAYELANRAPLGARAALTSGLPGVAVQIVEQMAQVAEDRLHASQAAQRCAEVPPVITADLMYRRAHALLTAGTTTRNVATDSIALTNPLHSSRLFKFIDTVAEVKGLCLAPATYRDGDLLEMLWRAWMQASRPTPNEARRTAR